VRVVRGIQSEILRREKTAGFTVIEMMIALAIFSIAALAIAAMTFMSIQGNAMTNQMSQATFLAQDKMEELLSFQSYKDFKDTGLAASSDAVAGDQTSGGVYTRNWSATCDGAVPPATTVTPHPSACWADVTVIWADAKGSHQVAIRSLWRRI